MDLRTKKNEPPIFESLECYIICTNFAEKLLYFKADLQILANASKNWRAKANNKNSPPLCFYENGRIIEFRQSYYEKQPDSLFYQTVLANFGVKDTYISPDRIFVGKDWFVENLRKKIEICPYSEKKKNLQAFLFKFLNGLPTNNLIAQKQKVDKTAQNNDKPQKIAPFVFAPENQLNLFE